MLSHISQKFAQPIKAQPHEPRAALFLNRFTKTLSIMYATSGIQDIVGIPAESMRGRSFYYCIAQNCLQDAIECLETAKGNDSIAYLRFWFRDPRQDDLTAPDSDSDEEMTTDTSMSVDNDEGGIGLRSQNGTSRSSAISITEQSTSLMDVDTTREDSKPGSSGDSTHEADTHEAIFGQHRASDSSASSMAPSPVANRSPGREPPDPIELEAVISCTSDGLVVCLRRARPMIPHPLQRPSKPVYQNGLFAAPWAKHPIIPGLDSRARAGFNSGFAPALGPQAGRHPTASPARASDNSEFMNAIRDQAIFAWGVTGINGALAEYGQGKPLGESLPLDGLPIWANDSKHLVEDGRDPQSVPNGHNGMHNGVQNGIQNGMPNGLPNNRLPDGVPSKVPNGVPNGMQNGFQFGLPGGMQNGTPNGRSEPHIFGDPGLGRNGSSSGTRSASSGYGTSNSGTPQSR